MKNILVTTNKANLLVYTETLTEEELTEFINALRRPSEHVIDTCEVQQDELQYYCIDSRVWADTPTKETAIRQLTEKWNNQQTNYYEQKNRTD